MENKIYKVGKVAEVLDITTRTIRYYEEEELIKPERTEKGTRLYIDKDIERLRLITQMAENGFSLSMIKTFLSLDEEKRDMSANSVRDMIKAKISKLTILQEEVLNFTK